MRVLFVSQEFPPETGWGGIGTYVASVTQALSAAGIEVHVLSVVEGQPMSTNVVDGVTVHRRSLPHVRGPGRYAPEGWARLWLALGVAHFARRLRPPPTVIECPDWKAEGLGLALTGRFPLAVRLHSTSRQIFRYSGQGGSLSGADGQLAMRLEEDAVRRANVVLSTRANFEDVGPQMGLDRRGAHYIPHIVRLPAKRPYPDAGNAPLVAFVGRLEPRKAPEVVLRAVPRVLAAVPEARFVFVGRTATGMAAPSSSTSLQREAERLGVAQAVELRGGLAWEEVADQLAQASVCVFPSRWECFPNVTAEASAIGRPVIVSAITGFREMVVHGVTGTVVPDESPEAWAAAIIELLMNRDRAAALGGAGSELIRRVSEPHRIARLTIDAYEDAIARWRRGELVGGGGRLTWRR
jgi:glycosyltransferase involved in cell wall biosynthesis